MELEPTATAGRPFAYSDSRALSRAWYDALHFSHSSPAARAESVPRRLNAHADVRPARLSPAGSVREETAPGPPSESVQAKRAVSARFGNSPDRQGVEADDLRSDEPDQPAPSAASVERTDVAFELRSGHTVMLMLQNDGHSMRATAVCERDASERVARALAEATRSLAARGIALNATTRQRGDV